MRIRLHTDSIRVQFVIGMSALLGLDRVVESPHRYQSAAYVAAKAAMPIRTWGAVFVLMAVLLYVVWRAERPAASWREPWWWPVRSIAGVGGVVWLLWGVLSGESAQQTGQSSYAGALLYGGFALIHGVIVIKGK